MRKFSDDDKKVSEFSESNWLPYGVSKVIFGLIENGTTENDKEYIEVAVIGPNEEEDTARVWFTTDNAANYSFNTLRSIYVHNAPEDKKEKAREDFDKVVTTDDIVALMGKLCGKGELWFTKYPDPTRTYVNQAGETKKSINKNIYGYEPKPRPELMPKEDVVADVDTDKPVTAKDLGGAEDKDAAANIPSDW